VAKDEGGDVSLNEGEELVDLSFSGRFGLFLETEGFPDEFCLVEGVGVWSLEFAFFCEGSLGGVGGDLFGRYYQIRRRREYGDVVLVEAPFVFEVVGEWDSEVSL
jgi:hypothetical protein